jgi:hypothetical protein
VESPVAAPFRVRLPKTIAFKIRKLGDLNLIHHFSYTKMKFISGIEVFSLSTNISKIKDIINCI